FLGGNELLGKFAALFGKRRELAEQSPIRANQVKTGEEKGNESRGQEQIDLALDAAVNLRDSQRRLFFALVVLYQQPGDSRAQRFLPGAQRDSTLRPGLRLVGVARQGKGPIRGVPELRDRILQILLLVGRAVHRGHLL